MTDLITFSESLGPQLEILPDPSVIDYVGDILQG